LNRNIIILFCATIQISTEAGDDRHLAVAAGGWTKDGDERVLSSTELYNSQGMENCDVTLPDLPSGRMGMVGGWIGGKAVVCGGENIDGEVFSECFYLDLQLGDWVYLQMMEVPRSMAGSVVIGEDCLVVMGGKIGVGVVTDSVEVVGGNCGMEVPDMLDMARYGHCVVEVGGEMVVVGGSPGNYGTTSVWSMEGGWRIGSGPQKERDGHDCSQLVMESGETTVLLAGNSFSPPDLAEVYFPALDTWEWTGYMQTERAGGKLVNLMGHPTMLGGYGGGYWDKQFYKSGEYYSDTMNHWWTWQERNLTEGRKHPVVFSVPDLDICNL